MREAAAAVVAFAFVRRVAFALRCVRVRSSRCVCVALRCVALRHEATRTRDTRLASYLLRDRVFVPVPTPTKPKPNMRSDGRDRVCVRTGCLVDHGFRQDQVMNQDELGWHNDYLNNIRKIIEGDSVDNVDIPKTVQNINRFLKGCKGASECSRTKISKIVCESNEKGSIVLPYDILQVIDHIVLDITTTGFGINNYQERVPPPSLIIISNINELNGYWNQWGMEISGSVGMLRENLMIVVISNNIVGDFLNGLGNNNVDIPFDMISYAIEHDHCDPGSNCGLIVCDAILYIESKHHFEGEEDTIQAIYPDGTRKEVKLHNGNGNGNGNGEQYISIFVMCGIVLLYDTEKVHITSCAICSWIPDSVLVPITMSGYQTRVCEMLVRFGIFKNTSNAFNHITTSLSHQRSLRDTKAAVSLASQILQPDFAPEQRLLMMSTSSSSEGRNNTDRNDMKAEINKYCLTYFNNNNAINPEHIVVFDMDRGKWKLTEKYSKQLFIEIRQAFTEDKYKGIIGHKQAWICPTCAQIFLKKNHKPSNCSYRIHKEYTFRGSF